MGVGAEECRVRVFATLRARQCQHLGIWEGEVGNWVRRRVCFPRLLERLGISADYCVRSIEAEECRVRSHA